MSTLEALIALGVTALTLAAIVLVVFGNQSLVLDSAENVLAQGLAVAELERARALAQSDWDALRTSARSESGIALSLEVLDVDDFAKQVASVARYEQGGVEHAVTLTTDVVDLVHAREQSLCRDESGSDWAHPVVSDVLDLGTPGVPTGLAVHDGIAYITVDGDGTAPDFYVVDVHDHPQILWYFDTGPGLMGVRVVGDYAYVANTSVTGQLQIINLRTKTYQNYRLPGATSGGANALYTYHDQVYLGTPKSTNAELHIIDVAAPTAPREIGTWEFGHAVNALCVSNGVAYVATPDAEELKLLDVREPSAPRLIGGYDAAGGSGNGKSLVRKGTRLYLGRTVGSDELYSLDVQDIYGGAVARGNVDTSVNGIVTMGEYLFLATSDAARELQVWRQAEDPAVLERVGSADLISKASGVACAPETIYLTTTTPSQGLVVLHATP